MPSFNAGISGFYFNPQTEYKGVYYNLRPVGTEGQTTRRLKRMRTAKFALSIPVGMKLERHINQNCADLAMSWTYHKLFYRPPRRRWHRPIP